MPEFPSPWNIVLSTIVFFISAWYFNRLLNDQDIPKGMTRSLLVFVLACMLSWGAGELIDWMQGSQSKADARQDVSKLLKQIGGEQPSE
ncbi:MAG: hypothetical protein HOO95_07400 [Gallionella sp.]|nr:hypothetical protein [Gallionella sp.]